MLKLLVGALLTITAVNAVAGNMYIYKDKEGKTLLTTVNPSGSLVPNVEVTEFDENDKVTKIKRYNVRQVRKATAQSGDYSPEAYESKFTFIDEKNYSDKRNITYKSNGVQIGE
jgi:hypothetical protein